MNNYHNKLNYYLELSFLLLNLKTKIKTKLLC